MKYIEILVKLRKIIRSINLESKKIEKELGVSIPQLLVLQYLSDQDDYKAFAKDIKAYINLNASTVSGIISRLENKGFVARLPKPNDKRAIYITLTAKGAELIQKSPTTLQEKLSQKLKKLTPLQIDELDKNIELLTSIMDVEDIDAAPLLTIKEMTNSSEE
ncbi:MarR family winged helix-turn-helix transcriptional regulator [Aquimarina muelleri]|uniref:MarR family transcriptional regulator n=1 Tax=Aquimarina muelleri TaxID=279356 RepID=A0A918JUZ7_9FLAO|nr:MarR family transcriptional regulator [Aquimarina muelleri]MCX2763118.1 MarR family transcriptional regulator [Aquimarina muelleri]GGX06523.1 MarR family transcriptional regulator [Aquimarina muelleri]